MATTRAHQDEGRSNQTKQSKIDFHEIIIILGITLLAYIIEYLKYEFKLSILNIFLFINLIGLYFIIKKFKIEFHISLN